MPPQSFSSFVVVLVLDFLGHGKRTDCQQRSKIENEQEDNDEDDFPSGENIANELLFKNAAQSTGVAGRLCCFSSRRSSIHQLDLAMRLAKYATPEPKNAFYSHSPQDIQASVVSTLQETMNSEPFVRVVTPVYNGGASLVEGVEGVPGPGCNLI